MPILVANVVNGPDSAVDKTWADVIDQASAAGKTVLSYVRTGYLGVSSKKFLTRLGSGDLADWTAQIEKDINVWYTFYGSSIGGIFSTRAGLNRTHPGAYTVLNPGSPMASCFKNTMDTLLTSSWITQHTLLHTHLMTGYRRAKDSRKIWHTVYNATASAVGEVAILANDRGAGFLQPTNDLLPNPYDTLPGKSYMQSMNTKNGGSLLNADASSWRSGSTAGAVSGQLILSSDYSSAKSLWNAASNALWILRVLRGGIIASVLSSMTTLTTGGLKPGTIYELYVSAVEGGGYVGSPSSTVTVNTKSLPGGESITNYHCSPGTDSTTFTTDILVPCASTRLYNWDSVGCEFDTNPEDEFLRELMHRSFHGKGMRRNSVGDLLEGIGNHSKGVGREI